MDLLPPRNFNRNNISSNIQIISGSSLVREGCGLEVKYGMQTFIGVSGAAVSAHKGQECSKPRAVGSEPRAGIRGRNPRSEEQEWH